MTNTTTANPAMLAPKPKGPVCRNTKLEAVAAPTFKRGFFAPRIFGSSALALPHMVKGGMAEAVTPGARLRACYEHPARPMPFVRLKADYLGSLEGIQTMTPTTQGRIAPTPTSATHHHTHQLFADALNCAAMARYYTQRGNLPAAARKARQHLAALRALAKLEGGAV